MAHSPAMSCQPELADPEMRRAFECAYEVSDMIYNLQRKTTTDRFMMELASVIMDGIRSVEKKTPFPESAIVRMSYFVSCDAQSTLIKLGWSLTVLLERLLLRAHSTKHQTESRPLDPEREIKEEQADFVDEPNDTGFMHMASKDSESVGVYSESNEKEIKEEPADFDEDIKQEGPLVDNFCPITGEARPIEIDLHEDAAMESEAGPSEISSSISALRKGGRPNPANLAFRMRRKRTCMYVPGPSVPMVAEVHLKSDGKPLTRKCYLCGKSSDKFFVTPWNQPEREEFMQRIIIRSKADRLKLDTARQTGYRPIVCAIHVADLQMKVAKNTVPSQFARPIRPKCDLCDRPEYPCRFSPRNDPAKFATFLAGLTLSLEQRGKMMSIFYISKDRSAIVCRKHFRQTTESARSLSRDKQSRTANITQSERLKRKFGEASEQSAVVTQPTAEDSECGMEPGPSGTI